MSADDKESADVAESNSEPLEKPAGVEEVSAPDILQNSVVTIGGLSGSGTGFIAMIKDKPFVVTNVHVIGGIESPEIHSLNGEDIQYSTMFIAEDRDIAIIPIAKIPEGVTPLKIADSISKFVKIKDPMIVCGNSLGAGVLLASKGYVLGLGPKYVETNCAIYRGNSGSPFLHTNSNEVIGVATLVISVNTKDSITKNTLQKSNSGVKAATRYIGTRLDNVSNWTSVTQQVLYKNISAIKMYRARLILYFNFLNAKEDKDLPANLSASPEFERLSQKFLRDKIKRDGTSSHSRFLNAKNEYIRNLEILFNKERLNLLSIKAPEYLRSEQKMYAELYEELIGSMKSFRD